jgi:hypothetical protein
MAQMSPIRLVLCMIVWMAANRTARAADPVPIQRDVAQMFVDDYLIGSQTDLRRTLRQPKKDGDGHTPVLELSSEFGNATGTLEANGTIVFDPKLKKYVMLALGYGAQFEGPLSDRIQLLRFTSDDAMHWIKGDNGTPQRLPLDLLDKESGQSATNIDLFSFFYDAKDSVYPYKGWLYFANWGEGREGVYYMQSRDGLAWERGRIIMLRDARKIEQDGRTLLGVGDVTTFYHDDQTDRFLALIKFTSDKGVGPNNKNILRSRAYLWVDRLDKPVDLNLVKKVELLPTAANSNGDLPDDEYYAAGAWRYQSLFLGEVKVWHGGGDYPYSAAGCAFLKLAVSRDGINWKKVPFANEADQPEVWLPNGKEGGNNGKNDGGYVTLFSQGPIRVGDELIYYYGSSSWGKNHAKSEGVRVSGGGIFRARIRPDGFVSVDAGTLTTKPLLFQGQDLFVNSVGNVKVELLDDNDKTVGEASINGDSLQHRVTFSGKSLRESLHKGSGRLKFTVGQGGQLFSFKCR